MIADDHPLFRGALREAVSGLFDRAEIGEAGTFEEVTDLLERGGEVALCSQQTVGWACVAAPEDRAVLESEITRLHQENAALKEALLSRGLPLPPGTMPEPPAKSDKDLTLRLPGTDDLDRVMGFVGRVWHRLVEAIANAQNQIMHKS